VTVIYMGSAYPSIAFMFLLDTLGTGRAPAISSSSARRWCFLGLA